ncbi:AraC family transcriptional regulator [Mucilaginibacter gotjawali]|uniref:AraC family transcriptional regulator n=1 Tax=Mucilaginibacter gotjawali TaxID=1550579 RepID=UPI0021D25946|nr:AraC family transcriptional regulator [Mucilaginibacter gotjawali]
MHSMILYFDRDLICRFANNACEDWFKTKPIDIIDKRNLADLFGIDYLIKTRAFNKEILEGREQVFKIDIQTRLREVRSAIVTYSPDNASGEIEGFYAHIVDVSSLNNQSFVIDLNGVEISRQYLDGRYKQLGEVVAFLKGNLTTEFPGIPELAKKILISESKLKRDFKANYGTTIFDYYRHLQMELAEKYINEKKASKKQMAILLNFSNPSNFSVCFRKYLNEKNSLTRNAASEKANNKSYRIFVAQLPVAAAMFDNELMFMVASEKWLDDNQLQPTEIKDKSLFEIFPSISTKYKKKLWQCLDDISNHNTPVYLMIEQDPLKQVRWNVSTWINENSGIGGLIICS